MSIAATANLRTRPEKSMYSCLIKKFSTADVAMFTCAPRRSGGVCSGKDGASVISHGGISIRNGHRLESPVNRTREEFKTNEAYSHTGISASSCRRTCGSHCHTRYEHPKLWSDRNRRERFGAGPESDELGFLHV